MAERALAVTELAGASPNPLGAAHRVFRIRWTGLVTGDVGQRLPMLDKIHVLSVHAYGTFAGGTSVAFQGSNADEVAAAPDDEWVALPDQNGTAIALTAAGIANLSALAAFGRPSVSGGAADSITVDALIIMDV